MADLYDRLFLDDETGIATHAFTGALVDYVTGNSTRGQIIAFFAMDSEAQVDFNTVCDAFDGMATTLDKVVYLTEFEAVMNVAKAGAKYTTKSAFRTRLGL